MPPFYGQQTNQPQQPGPQAYQPWQPQKSGYKNMSENAYATGVNAQANKDTAAFGALRDLGVAGQNFMGQLGNSRNNALMNSQIAHANAMGQMGAQYFNTYGQGMNVLNGLNAAASQAGADSNKYNALSNVMPMVGNTAMYNSQAMATGMGNMPNFNFGGGFGGGFGGFQSRGPEGTLASGNAGGPRVGGWPDGGRQFNAPPAPPYMQPGGGRPSNPYEPFNKSLPVLRDMMRGLDDPNNFANRARNDINYGFDTTQRNLMDPSIMNALNGQMAMGYDRLGSMYDRSDYGFNTNRGSARTQYNPWTQRFSY